jgi:hypothetical protein
MSSTPQAEDPAVATPSDAMSAAAVAQLGATQSGWVATNRPTVSVFDRSSRTAASNSRLVAFSDWRESGALPW